MCSTKLFICKMKSLKIGKASPSTLLLMCIMMHAVASLTCHRAEYQVGQECCPMCPAGTRVHKHCTEFRSTSCLPCDEETYMDEPTVKTECLSCRTCASGSGLKVKSSCFFTSNTVCEPLEGFFCVDSEEGSCVAVQKHTRCEPGSYISRQGSASADTVCFRCTEGTFSDGTLTQCQPHTQCELINKVTVKAGTSDSDAECAEKNTNTTVMMLSIMVVSLFIIISAISAVIYIRN